MMLENKANALNLAVLLERHIDEIAELWAEKIYHHAGSRSGELWHDSLRSSMKVGLRAVVDALCTGSHRSLRVYLRQVSVACLRSGFESGEVSELLLLSKEAILSVVRRYDFDCEAIWSMNSELDASLRWTVGQFNNLYAAEMNQRLRDQHEQMVSMLRLGARNPGSTDMDEIFHQLGENIMNAVEVDHCDFYLVDDQSTCFIPKLGPHRTPFSPEVQAHFLNTPPDYAHDVFYRELMARKEPQVSYNMEADPRVDYEHIKPMHSKSVLAVPLVSNDSVFAVAVTGTFHEFRTFTEEQIELAWDIARAVVLVIENARLHEQNQQIAVLHERERLGREIHDNLAQALSILKLQASAADGLLKDGKIAQAQTLLGEMVSTASEAHVDAREAIFSLRHSASFASDFLPTLRSHLERLRASYGLDAHLVLPDEASIELSYGTAVQLTRVIQEALANIRKHARAKIATVRLEFADHHLHITVEDDGVGFDHAHVSCDESGGAGLQIMRERIESLGGRLQIHSAPGKGTRIVAAVPMAEQR
jgi:signal transduction histidine kinase